MVFLFFQLEKRKEKRAEAQKALEVAEEAGMCFLGKYFLSSNACFMAAVVVNAVFWSSIYVNWELKPLFKEPGNSITNIFTLLLILLFCICCNV